MNLNIVKTKEQLFKELLFNLKLELMYVLRVEITDEEAIFMILLMSKLMEKETEDTELDIEIRRMQAQRRYHRFS